MLHTIIIDDEAHIRDSLIKLLSRHCPEVIIVGQADSVAGGIKAIREHSPDLVLLDIQMGDGTGFDLLNSFPSIDFRVIFVTAYDHYALHAFRYSAVDYLLKPVDPEMLADAIKRASQLLQDHNKLQISALKENLKNKDYQQRKIILKTVEKIHLIDIQHITCCESYDNYTSIHTSDGDKIVVSRSLKEFDELLAVSGFYRVHKSFLINLAYIRGFEKQEGGFVVLTGGMKVPVASRKREELLAIIEKMAE